jgi:hypothetical protein
MIQYKLSVNSSEKCDRGNMLNILNVSINFLKIFSAFLQCSQKPIFRLLKPFSVVN